MSLDIDAAIRAGFSRTFKRNGLVLIGVFFVFGLVNTVLIQAAATRISRSLSNTSAASSAAGVNATGPNVTGLADGGAFGLAVPLVVIVALVLLTPFVAEALRIIAVRTFVSDHTKSIPRGFARRHIVWATINGFVGGIAVWFLIIIGSVIGILGVVVGSFVVAAFFATSFFFVRQEIAVENKNFVDAMSDSWQLTSGHRIGLFAIAVAIWVIGLVFSIPGYLVGAVAVAGPVPAIGFAVVTAALNAVTTVFGIAVAARAYDQLRAERAAEEQADDANERAAVY